MKGFPIDLGAVTVTVEVSDTLSIEEKLGRSDLLKYRILLAQGMDGQDVTSVLLHEILHFVDHVYLNDELDSDAGHSLIDRLAVMIDMILTRNWHVFKTLYDAKHRRKAAPK